MTEEFENTQTDTTTSLEAGSNEETSVVENTVEAREVPDINSATNISDLRDAIQKKFAIVSKEIIKFSSRRRLETFIEELYIPAVSAFNRIAQNIMEENEEVRRLTCEIFAIGHAIYQALLETGVDYNVYNNANFVSVSHRLMTAPLTSYTRTGDAYFYYLIEDAKFLTETLPERFGPRYAIFGTPEIINTMAKNNPQDLINMIDNLSHDLKAVEFVTVIENSQVATLKRFFTS